MEALIIFILKSALLISLFFSAYFLLLKRDTSFQLNRIFLLIGILTSLSLPAVEITRNIVVEASVFTGNLQQLSSVESVPAADPVAATDWWFLTGGLYLAGVAFFVCRLLVQVLSLSFFLRKAEKFEDSGYSFYITDKEVAPFSFFKSIVYNPALHSSQELNLILRHEKAHARQWHSGDVLLSNLAACVLWFNPLAWIYKKYMLQNLEYLADRETVAASGSKKEYQKALLQATVGDLTPVLANHFYQSLIKKRIIMLNKQATSKNAGWKAGVILPFLVAFVLGFQVRTQAQVVQSTSPTDTANVSEDEFSITINSKSSQKSIERLPQLFKERGIELNFDSVERNADGVITNIQISFRKPVGRRTGTYSQNNSDGIRPFKFYTKKNGETGFQRVEESSPTAETSFTNDPGLITGKDLLIVLEGKVYEMKSLYGKYIQVIEETELLDPGQTQKRYGKTAKDGALVISKGKLVDDFDADIRKIDSNGAGANKDYLHVTEELGAVLINVNKRMSTSKSEADKVFNKSVFNNTGADSLSFIQKYNKSKLFTGAHAPAVQFQNSDATYISVLENQHQKPLIVVDGKVQPRDFDLKEIDHQNIKSITVLKNENATEKYGEKGKNGVIEINLKKEGEESPEPKISEEPKKDVTYTADKITIKTTADTSSVKEGEKESSITIRGVKNAGFGKGSHLYVLDGKVMENDFDPSTLDPGNIDSISVLRGKHAVEKYGEKAADGVIEINMKE